VKRRRVFNELFPTGKPLKKLLPDVLAHMGKRLEQKPTWVVAAWQDVIGPRLGPMTGALSFQEGILIVRVKNATLLSVLSQFERAKLLNRMREKFPSLLIRSIHFRIG